MHSTAVSTAGFVTPPVVITSDVTVNAPLDVRLVAPNMSYHQTFHLVAGTHSYNLAVPVQPQTYAVEVSDFIYDGVVYNTQTADYLVVLSTGKAQLHIDRLAGARTSRCAASGFPELRRLRRPDFRAMRWTSSRRARHRCSSTRASMGPAIPANT